MFHKWDSYFTQAGAELIRNELKEIDAMMLDIPLLIGEGYKEIVVISSKFA